MLEGEEVVEAAPEVVLRFDCLMRSLFAVVK
jgi:hypothetical protein